ncbi:MAG: methylmalonyl-CoA mutase small subunit, partial [Bacteroidales bacterium]
MARQIKLFDQFPPVTTKEWMDKITADLKGADFSKRLVWKTIEGFDVKPFYRREDVPAIGTGALRKTCNWLIRQDITITDYMAANRKALSILMKG